MIIKHVTTIQAINELHAQIEQALRESLDNAIQLGALLADVKQQLPHGTFTDWISDNCTFSSRTARRYMKIHEHRDQLGEADSLGEAYKLIAAPKTDTLSVLEQQQLADAEAVIAANIGVANGMLERLEKVDLAECHLRRILPEIRLPEQGEELKIYALKTLDEYLDDKHPFAALHVKQSSDYPGYYFVNIYRIARGEDTHSYEIYNKRPVLLKAIKELVLYYSKDFAFDAAECVEVGDLKGYAVDAEDLDRTPLAAKTKTAAGQCSAADY